MDETNCFTVIADVLVRLVAKLAILFPVFLFFFFTTSAKEGMFLPTFVCLFSVNRISPKFISRISVYSQELEGLHPLPSSTPVTKKINNNNTLVFGADSDEDLLKRHS